jgi:hypothetical protein
MRGMQNRLGAVLDEIPERLLSDLVAKKLEVHGVKLSARQLEGLKKQLLTGEGQFVHQPWKFWDRRKIDLKFTNEDFAELKGKADKLEKAMPEIIEALTSSLATKMLSDLKRAWPKEARELQKELAGFRARLRGRWRTPLDRLHLLFVICRELGADVNHELTQAKEFKDRRHLVEVLRRSHARACQITAEAMTLLEGGFADGAMARWRTLHEVAVTASFIAKHGEDLAERYVLHQAVESKRAAAEYQRCAPRLGYQPFDAAAMKAIHGEFDKVVARYGVAFGKGSYGWAAHHLGIAQPNFSQIEHAAQVDYLRAHYRMASHNVHANPKGVFFSLGLMPETPLLLAGPSNSGLTEPGQGTANSLSLVTAVFVTLHPSLDNNVALRAVTELLGEIGPAFGEAHRQLDADETALRAKKR